MKRLMWTLLSLMLFLGMGTASAQLATPSQPVLIKPANGATVEPNQPLSFARNEDYTGMQTCLFYTFDDNATFDVITSENLENLMNAVYDGKDVNGIYGCLLGELGSMLGEAGSFYDPEEPVVVAVWAPTPMIPSNASGQLTLRVCACNVSPMEGASSISPITTATYTVGAPTPVPAPTFSKASGSVLTGTKITVNKPVMDNGFTYGVLYVLNDPDFDFTQYKCADNQICEGLTVPTNMVYQSPIEITEKTTVTAITMKYEGYYEKIFAWSEPVSATYTIVVKPDAPEFEPAKGYVKPGQELGCTVSEAVLEEYGQVFVLYAENDADAVLESDYETLMKLGGNTPGVVTVAETELPYKVAVVEYDGNEAVWAQPVVISEDAPAEVKFRARTAVMYEDENGENTLIYSDEIATTYYTVVPAPVFEPASGLVTAGQKLGCTVPESFDWEQGNGVAVLIYIEDNDDFKLEEVPASEIATALSPSTDQDPDQDVEPARAYKLAVCTRDFDEDDRPFYEWRYSVAFSEDLDGTVSFRARLVMLTQNHEAEYEAAFSDEVKTYYYTKLPAPRFMDAGEVFQSDPLNVELPAEINFADYLDQAFILYVENDAEAVLTYNGTMGELQALAQGGSSVEPLSAKAALPYKVAVCDMEWQEWNPSVYLTALGQVNVRARLAVGTSWDGRLIYSDEITAAYTVKERPLNDKPTFVVDGKDVAGETAAVKKGAALSFKSGYEGNDDYIVCYVVNGKDEDFADATMAELVMGTSTVKVYEPDMTKLTIEEAQTVKAATVQELASGDLWWSEIVTVAFTIAPDFVAKPTFNPAAGEVKAGTEVEIACETEGATVYYTVDGAEPTEKSTPYKEAIVINKDMTVKAIAIKDDVKSEVAVAAYTIGVTANEDVELAGVNVYPNPSDGLFNIDLPVAATIEVFMSNGMLYRRLTLKEGHNTFNIERSGIYFFRITGEGRTVIKRVIVR